MKRLFARAQYSCQICCWDLVLFTNEPMRQMCVSGDTSLNHPVLVLLDLICNLSDPVILLTHV